MAIRGASQSEGNKIKETGTAVMTMKDCNADIPPDPREIRINAVTPIITPQKVLIMAFGSVSPLITTLMVYVIESPVVTIKMVVKIRNRIDVTIGIGN